jgi:hypothetical protein
MTFEIYTGQRITLDETGNVPDDLWTPGWKDPGRIGAIYLDLDVLEEDLKEVKPTKIHEVKYDPNKLQSITLENNDGTWTSVSYDVLKTWGEPSNWIIKIVPEEDGL